MDFMKNNENNKTLIITGGHIEDALIERRIREEEFSIMIAADHGLDAADRFDLPLDYIVEDFDSVSPAVLEKYRRSRTIIETFPARKDKTDTQIALERAISLHSTYIEILGATGSRLDHTLANLHLLLIPLQQKIPACILDSGNRIYLKNESFRIPKRGQYGDYISLLPFSDDVHGLTLEGFQYPLENVQLSSGSSLGISNVITEEQASVSFRQGILAVFETRDVS